MTALMLGNQLLPGTINSMPQGVFDLAHLHKHDVSANTEPTEDEAAMRRSRLKQTGSLGREFTLVGQTNHLIYKSSTVYSTIHA